MADALTPLVPPEVDLRGMPWMRLDTGRLLDSDLFALSTGEEFKAAVALWCKSWTQQPAASLPSDDRILAHLSGAGARWKKIKAMALRGWLSCEDGRLYHPVVAEQALQAWEERVAYRDERDAAAQRKREEREARAAMFDALRAAGHKPKWNTSTAELRDMLANLGDLSRVTGCDVSQGQAAPVTDKSQTCHRLREGEGEGEGSLKAFPRAPRASTGTEADGSGAAPEVVVTDIHGSPVVSPIAGLDAAQSATVVTACKALRKLGASRFHPGDDALVALALEGFTAEQMARVAAEKALRDSALWNDPDVHPELFDLLTNGASQQAMALTAPQYTALRSAAAQVSGGYIASTLRGRRRDLANQGQQAQAAPRGTSRRPSVTDNFAGKNYAGTSIDELSPELRGRVASQLAG